MRELSLHILDIAENGIRAEASRVDVDVTISEPADSLMLSVSDNGRGIPSEIRDSVTNPFVTTRTERKVGLGLPLLAEACRAAGGSLDIQSQPNKGTLVRAEFKLSHIDRAPMGNLTDTIVNLVVGYPDRQITLRFQTGAGEFLFDSKGVRDALDGVPLYSPKVVEWMRQHIAEGIGRLAHLE